MARAGWDDWPNHPRSRGQPGFESAGELTCTHFYVYWLWSLIVGFRMQEEKVKTHLVLPKKLLADMDKLVSPRQRSQFVADAAREKLERLRLERALEKAAGAWTDRNHPELTSPAAVKRYLRRLRSQTSRRLEKKLRG